MINGLIAFLCSRMISLRFGFKTVCLMVINLLIFWLTM